MEKLFQKIKQNDRIFIQKLPPDRLEQTEQGFFIDQASSSALGGFTPLTLALTLGHLDLAVDTRHQIEPAWGVSEASDPN